MAHHLAQPLGQGLPPHPIRLPCLASEMAGVCTSVSEHCKRFPDIKGHASRHTPHTLMLTAMPSQQTRTRTHTHTHMHTLAVPELPPSVVFPPPPEGITPVTDVVGVTPGAAEERAADVMVLDPGAALEEANVVCCRCEGARPGCGIGRSERGGGCSVGRGQEVVPGLCWCDDALTSAADVRVLGPGAAWEEAIVVLSGWRVGSKQGQGCIEPSAALNGRRVGKTLCCGCAPSPPPPHPSGLRDPGGREDHGSGWEGCGSVRVGMTEPEMC
eukprot:1160788-Pelagomonas_calceolata.AAC.6